MYGKRQTGEQVRRLIARDRIGAAIDRLDGRLPDAEDRRTLTHLAARWEDLRRREMAGTIPPEDGRIERARIREGLLELSRHTTGGPRRGLLFLLLAAALLAIFLLGYALWPRPAPTLPAETTVPTTPDTLYRDSIAAEKSITPTKDTAASPPPPETEPRTERRPFLLRGRVKYRGRPTGGVTLFGPGGTTARSGPDGGFTLRLPAPPNYPFQLIATRNEEEVTKTIKAPTPLVTIAFPQYVRGKVRQDGAPAAGVEITTQWGDRTLSRADGAFELPLDPERQYNEKFYITCRRDTTVEKIVRAGQENVVVDL